MSIAWILLGLVALVVLGTTIVFWVGVIVACRRADRLIDE